jgi:hypothetical protein
MADKMKVQLGTVQQTLFITLAARCAALAVAAPVPVPAAAGQPDHW